MNNINDVIQQHEKNIAKEERNLRGLYSPTSLPVWSIIFVLLLLFVTYLSPNIGLNSITITLTSVFGTLLGLFCWWVFRGASKASIEYNKRQLLVIDSSAIVKELKDDFFTKLVEINFKYIDRYYDRTENQARSAFNITVFVSITSFLLISIGVIMAFLDKQSPATLATIGGVLGEFIAGVFFYLYSSTVKKMSQYHSKLVLTQNIGIALKVSEKLPDSERPQVQARLIETLSEKINSHLTNTEST